MIHALTVLSLCVCHLPAAQTHAAETKANIVVIVADGLGYADVLFNPQHPKEVATKRAM